MIMPHISHVPASNEPFKEGDYAEGKTIRDGIVYLVVRTSNGSIVLKKDDTIERIKKLENAMTAQACRDAGKQFYEQVPETTQRHLYSMLDKVCEDYKRLNLQRAFNQSESIYKQHGDNLLDAFIVLRDAVKKFFGA